MRGWEEGSDGGRGEERRGSEERRREKKRDGRIVEYLRENWLPFKAFKFTKSEINGFSFYWNFWERALHGSIRGIHTDVLWIILVKTNQILDFLFSSLWLPEIRISITLSFSLYSKNKLDFSYDYTSICWDKVHLMRLQQRLKMPLCENFPRPPIFVLTYLLREAKPINTKGCCWWLFVTSPSFFFSFKHALKLR